MLVWIPFTPFKNTRISGRYAPLILAPAEGGHFPRFARENDAPLIQGWGLTDGQVPLRKAKIFSNCSVERRSTNCLTIPIMGSFHDPTADFTLVPAFSSSSLASPLPFPTPCTTWTPYLQPCYDSVFGLHSIYPTIDSIWMRFVPFPTPIYSKNLKIIIN